MLVDRSWQGCVCRTLRQRDASRPLRERHCASSRPTCRTTACPVRAISTRTRRRSMQDMRDVVHELVVNQLGVKQAYYLGHSLGGQVDPGLCAELAGRGEGTDSRSAGGAGGVSAPKSRSRPARRQSCSIAAFGRDFDKWQRGLGPDRYPRQRNCARRAEHPRLLLLQEARSGDRVPCRKPRAATS